MYTSWIIGLLLLVQQTTTPDSLIITQNGQTIESIERESLSLPFTGVSLVDTNNFHQFIEKIDQKVTQAPTNAKLDEHGQIIPEKVGYKLYHQKFTEQFYTYFYGNGSHKIEVPLLVVHPKVDSEILANIRVQKIGEYVTFFNSYNQNRSKNIALAVEAIDNYVVFPGETFSFNRVVGRRTKEKGYLSAKVIVKGEFSEGIGGGICQVSSTLFNAIDRAGLKITERFSHSRSVPYVPPGRDATVSWYGPDFQFENKYNQPILIKANAHAGVVRISVYSSDLIDFKARKIPHASSQPLEEVRVCSGENCS
jgi:vancomycin resistance protein YoaR